MEGEEEPITQEDEERAKGIVAKNEELLIEAKNFFDFHKKSLGASLRKEQNVIFLDFLSLTEFSNKLADLGYTYVMNDFIKKVAAQKYYDLPEGDHNNG